MLSLPDQGTNFGQLRECIGKDTVKKKIPLMDRKFMNFLIRSFLEESQQQWLTFTDCSLCTCSLIQSATLSCVGIHFRSTSIGETGSQAHMRKYGCFCPGVFTGFWSQTGCPHKLQQSTAAETLVPVPGVACTSACGLHVRATPSPLSMNRLFKSFVTQ